LFLDYDIIVIAGSVVVPSTVYLCVFSKISYYWVNLLC